MAIASWLVGPRDERKGCRAPPQGRFSEKRQNRGGSRYDIPAEDDGRVSTGAPAPGRFFEKRQNRGAPPHDISVRTMEPAHGARGPECSGSPGQTQKGGSKS